MKRVCSVSRDPRREAHECTLCEPPPPILRVPLCVHWARLRLLKIHHVHRVVRVVSGRSLRSSVQVYPSNFSGSGRTCDHSSADHCVPFQGSYFKTRHGFLIRQVNSALVRLDSVKLVPALVPLFPCYGTMAGNNPLAPPSVLNTRRANMALVRSDSGEGCTCTCRALTDLGRNFRVIGT